MLSKILLAAAAGIAATSVAAADYTPPAKRVSPDAGLVAQLKPKGETPRTADGHPDLTGIWGGGPVDAPYTQFGVRGLQYLEPDQAAMQRGNAWNRPIYKPELWEKVHHLDFGKVWDDPGFRCLPHGAPRMNAPNQIVMTSKVMVAMNGGSELTTRVIPLDGRKRDDIDSDYSNYNGLPLGRWDGDTLVIESIGFTDQTWFLWTGYFHSDKMKVTERLTRKGDILYYQFVVDDPEVLVQPWTSDMYVRRLNPNPLARMEEVPPCKEQDEHEIADPDYRG